MDVPANPDLELARMIVEGDRRRAASLLARRYADDVFALCRAMVRDATLAEDLAQDSFQRALAALGEYRADASVRTWLLRIARNRCIDHLRAARRAPWTEDEPDDHASGEPLAIDRLTDREDAERALGSLGESERAIVVLHFGHGVGYAELAEAFGLREGAVRMRVSRALARMREAIEASDGAAPARALSSAPVLGAARAPAPAMPEPAATRGEGLLARFRRALGGPASSSAGERDDARGAMPKGGAPSPRRAPTPPAAPSSAAPSSAAPSSAAPSSAAPSPGAAPPAGPPPSAAPIRAPARAAAIGSPRVTAGGGPGAGPLHDTPLHERAPQTLLARLAAWADAVA